MGLIMISKERAEFLRFVNSMYDKQGFDIDALRRKFSKYFKTTAVSNRFTFHFKDTGSGFLFTHEPLVNGVCCVHVLYSSKYPNVTFDFHVTSNKHFIQKIIKHNLI